MLRLLQDKIPLQVLRPLQDINKLINYKFTYIIIIIFF